MHSIIRADKAIFHLVNSQWSNPFFDGLMPWLRISYFWVPLYIFLLVFAATNFKKNAWWWILFAAATAGITDYVSASIIKANIPRLRPFLDPTIASTVKLLVSSRPMNSSFVSSHAANHFGMAAFIYFTLKDYYGKPVLLFFFWAFAICFAQVYVGVHFPLDVFCGGIIGFVFGYLSAKSFNRRFSLM